MSAKSQSSAWRIFRGPLFWSLATGVGLVTGLVGDGLLADAISWLTLGGLVATMLFFYWKKP